MITPQIPTKNIVDSKGELTQEWRAFFANLVGQLGYHLPPNGTIIPHASSNDINSMEREYLDDQSRNDSYGQRLLVINKDTGEALINVGADGDFKAIKLEDRINTTEC